MLTWARMAARTFLLMTGMAMSSRILLVCNLGNTFLRMIFSMTSGTAIMMRGLTSASAWAMTAGEGTRLR